MTDGQQILTEKTRDILLEFQNFGLPARGDQIIWSPNILLPLRISASFIYPVLFQSLYLQY
jgi:hypothetical protein